MLYSTTSTDAIYSTVQFVAVTILYPEIAGGLSPDILADPFFKCSLDGRVVPNRLEHAISIGMARVSVLVVVKPENDDLKELCGRIDYDVQWHPHPNQCSPLWW